MNISLRPAKDGDLLGYTDLLQRTYEDAYVNDELGLTKKQFSQEVFGTDRVQEYLRSNLITNENQESWLANDGSKLVGSITIKKLEQNYVITGFYVAPEYQGKGVGGQLYKKALEFATSGDIIVDLYTHSKKSLEMYKKWGFMIDTTRGTNGYFYRHWSEWPADLRAECVYMRLTRSYFEPPGLKGAL